MISIVLYNPVIPPNTGNIMRLCSNTGFDLHIIEPIGFPLDNKSLKRAKLDYFSDITPKVHKNFQNFIKDINLQDVFAISKFGKKIYSDTKFKKNNFFLFGSETKGLPEHILKKLENQTLNIPMKNNSRSINLSNAVSIVVYEVWRQLKFSGAEI